MLWKKESNRPNALYVDLSEMKGFTGDLFRDFEHHLKVMFTTTNEIPVPQKNDAESLAKRQEGNEMFIKRKWVETLEKYNDSLCLAELGSPHISLAYANRSAVFFHLKQFDRCLKDIELAKESGYPDELRPKLDQRISDCLKYIDEGAQCVDTTVKLSYEPDDKFPCLANVLQVEKNANGKCRVIAKEDIAIGQTILLEKSFISYLFNRFGSKCNICLRANVNLMPCSKCTTAMFCSAECQEHPLHQYECGVKLCDNEILTKTVMKDFRIILLVINMYATADDLMKFVEKVKKSGPNDLPLKLSDDQSKYRAFLKQKTCIDCIATPNDLALNIKPIYDGIMNIPDVKSKFQSLRHRRFLMHLIALHSLMGCHGGCCNGIMQDDIPIDADDIKKCKLMNNAQVGLIATYFTHSNTPNMLSIRGNGKQAGIVIRPIKKGDEILNSCAPYRFDATTMPRPFLASAIQQQQIDTDSDWNAIINHAAYKPNIDPQKQIDQCISVLNKFNDVGFCKQINLIINVLGSLIRPRLDS